MEKLMDFGGVERTIERKPQEIADEIRITVEKMNLLMVEAYRNSIHVYMSAEGNWNGDGKQGRVEIPSTPKITINRVKQQLEF